MPKIPALTDAEKAYFDTIRTKAALAPGEQGALYIARMLLDGQPVAVVGTDVYNRFSHRLEGTMPLAVLLTGEALLNRLTGPDGSGGVVFSPSDLDPTL